MSVTDAAARDAGNVTGERDNDRAGCFQDTVTVDERAYVGALLSCDAADARQCMALVRADDLADPFLRTLHEIIRRMLGEGAPVDSTTVPAFVRQHALMPPGPALTMINSRVAELAIDAPVGCTVVFHAENVAQQGIRRRGASECSRLARIYAGADIDAIPAAVERVHAGLVADLARVGGGR